MILSAIYIIALPPLSFIFNDHERPVTMASSYPVYGNALQPQYPYPPSNNLSFGNSTTTFSNAKMPSDDVRRTSRTPSPTPSEEAELLRDGLMDYKAMMNWRFWIRREWLCASDVHFFVVRWLMVYVYRVLCYRRCYSNYHNPHHCLTHPTCTRLDTRHQLDA